MVLEPGAADLPPVIEIFGPDEADHGVDEERLELPRHRIGVRLKRLLVDAVMSVGRERAPLAGLEIHHVVADRAAFERKRRLAAFLESGEVDTEALIRGLGA